MGLTNEITFSGNILTRYNEADGKAVFEYSFPNGIGSGQIQCRNVATGKISTLPFKYISQYDIVVLGNNQYHKK